MTTTRPREAELHRVATELFRERGFHATSMQDLADALGLNRSSLYHYIAAKDDLLWTIVSEALEHLDAHVRPELDGPGRGVDRVRRAIAARLRFAAETLAGLLVDGLRAETVIAEPLAVSGTPTDGAGASHRQVPPDAIPPPAATITPTSRRTNKEPDR